MCIEGMPGLPPPRKLASRRSNASTRLLRGPAIASIVAVSDRTRIACWSARLEDCDITRQPPEWAPRHEVTSSLPFSTRIHDQEEWRPSLQKPAWAAPPWPVTGHTRRELSKLPGQCRQALDTSFYAIQAAAGACCVLTIKADYLPCASWILAA
ncbi:hypothetical protein DOTSEDRAFT_34750 [Dothistroma septosporum NZE10]|uniref:Uncharacterized protein n=1 Tax=Dothistroma septosporum (strain NZE10 / CBS 128990) TaxID=675120 RepID=N1PL92_DOTSN|nr:hypothetical protein DOTSEDRAFT_34750 [Dothistroma septosporum NZE10]